MRINIFREIGLRDSEEALRKLERLLMRSKLTYKEMHLITRLSFLLGNASALELLERLGYEDVAEEVALSYVDFTNNEKQ